MTIPPVQYTVLQRAVKTLLLSKHAQPSLEATCLSAAARLFRRDSHVVIATADPEASEQRCPGRELLPLSALTDDQHEGIRSLKRHDLLRQRPGRYAWEAELSIHPRLSSE